VADLTFRRFDTQGARAQRDTVALIHRDAYAAVIDAGDPFEFPEAFMKRFDAYTARPTFDLVIAQINEEPAGQTWGWPLDTATGAGWWRWLTTEVEPGFTDEDGTRTFALSEIMVCRAWTGQGVAHALHDELLAARPEQRAILLVRPENEVAYRAYLKWGWRKEAQLRPNWPDAPLFDVLVLPLPIPR
jgi:GNAT superfamily N-acetyltransferase